MTNNFNFGVCRKDLNEDVSENALGIFSLCLLSFIDWKTRRKCFGYSFSVVGRIDSITDTSENGIKK